MLIEWRLSEGDERKNFGQNMWQRDLLQIAELYKPYIAGLRLVNTGNGREIMTPSCDCETSRVSFLSSIGSQD
jgi:hypothetical protein